MAINYCAIRVLYNPADGDDDADSDDDDDAINDNDANNDVGVGARKH
jgi:hypothetical protein